MSITSHIYRTSAVMTGTHKNVLALGLLDLASTRNTVQKELEKGSAAGFAIEAFAVKPDDEDSLEELRQKLNGKHWDVVTIGYGVRGNKDYTSTFEKVINMCIQEVKPPPKLGFSKSPDDVFDAIKRVVPQ